MHIISNRWRNNEKLYPVVVRVCENFEALVTDVVESKKAGKGVDGGFYDLSIYFRRDINPDFLKNKKVKISKVDAFIIKSLMDIEWMIENRISKNERAGLSTPINRLSFIDSIGYRIGTYLHDDVLSDLELMMPAFGGSKYLGNICVGYEATDQMADSGVSINSNKVTAETIEEFGCMPEAHNGDSFSFGSTSYLMGKFVIDSIIKHMTYEDLQNTRNLFGTIMNRNEFASHVRESLLDTGYSSFSHLLDCSYGVYLAGLWRRRNGLEVLHALGQELLYSLSVALLALRDRLRISQKVFHCGDRIGDNLYYYFNELQNRPYYRIIRNYLILPLELELGVISGRIKSTSLYSVMRDLWRQISKCRKEMSKRKEGTKEEMTAEQLARLTGEIFSAAVSGSPAVPQLATTTTNLRDAGVPVIGSDINERGLDELGEFLRGRYVGAPIDDNTREGMRQRLTAMLNEVWNDVDVFDGQRDPEQEGDV